ncbi:sedoheptulokinase-like isoform X2 [Macrosteles quadrilineatus]|uniref:sedoheptulokinase-like isoform X1 n=1 Tax=Macrosteles quadrilineatus TaxID=74068 RepID=UPI0023E2D24B|nr:sedoheptulokinase-like isoform X1 [Macrosteles quadrilineatus]XP_054264249.1 sedoheptulokinase-like isoform X1 [Macrosteles quadrilineatus]XP_054289622.1 sedoheptulokinase-like isoform X2 [Macrosteles quadrilineatus]
MSTGTDQRIILGLDIGTTSVKVCLVDWTEGKVVARQTKDTQANVPSELGCEGNKQNVPKIMSAVHICVSRLPKELLRQVEIIGICGQMHGVMLWHYDTSAPWERADIESSRYDIVPTQVSNLYTWQDSRCDPDFLSSLPKPDSHLRAYSGYGCNTLFWIAKNRPEKLERFNCAGTVQDFMVAMLANLKRPVMSVQNAASWGYFNTEDHSWNSELLEGAGFPTSLLPEVIPSGDVAGTLADQWHGIPVGTPIAAALGDLQCSVLATLRNLDDAVLNISTSAQLGFVAANFQTDQVDASSPVEYFPYFDGKYLAVATALNGGNALATFIQMLQQWTLDLGFNMPQSSVWSKVLELGSQDSSESTLCVIPTLLGERHSPQQNASITTLVC